MRALYSALSCLLIIPCATFAQGTGDPTMPGKPVGLSSVQPVGTRLPTVGTKLPKVGNPLPGYGDKQTTPFQGNYPKVDPNLVVAPYPTEQKQDDFWDSLLKRFALSFGGDKPPTPQYTPGISRRNRDRAKEHAQQEMLRRMRS